MEKLELIIKAADSKRAENISVLDVKDFTIISDYFILMSADTKRQVQAIANEIIDKAKENDVEILKTEGLSEGQWVVIDFGDYLVHIFDTESYEFYQLYRLWTDAKQVDVTKYLTEG